MSEVASLSIKQVNFQMAQTAILNQFNRNTTGLKCVVTTSLMVKLIL